MVSKKSRKRQKFKDSGIAKTKKVDTNNKSSKTWVYVLALAVFVLAVYGLISSLSTSTPEAIGPSYGAEDGEIVFIQFGCFTCPFTQQFNLNVVPRLVEEFSQEVTFVFRSSPISSNPGSRAAAAAAKCADRQDAFWEYSQILFSSASFDQNSLISYANSLELDVAEFSSCLVSDEIKNEVDKDFRDARRAGIMTTPTTFVNGVKVSGVQDVSLFRRLFNDMLSDQ